MVFQRISFLSCLRVCRLKLFFVLPHLLYWMKIQKIFCFFINCWVELLFLLSVFGLGVVLGSVGFQFFDRI